MWTSEDNLWVLVLSLCHVGPGDRTHIFKPGSQEPLPTGPSKLAGLLFFLNMLFFFYEAQMRRASTQPEQKLITSQTLGVSDQWVSSPETDRTSISISKVPRGHKECKSWSGRNAVGCTPELVYLKKKIKPRPNSNTGVGGAPHPQS